MSGPEHRGAGAGAAPKAPKRQYFWLLMWRYPWRGVAGRGASGCCPCHRPPRPATAFLIGGGGGHEPSEPRGWVHWSARPRLLMRRPCSVMPNNASAASVQCIVHVHDVVRSARTPPPSSRRDDQPRNICPAQPREITQEVVKRMRGLYCRRERERGVHGRPPPQCTTAAARRTAQVP